MKLKKVQELLDAKVVSSDIDLNTEVRTGCGSDMMSDVLAFAKDQGILLTGLVNAQVIRTAGMMDMVCIVFVRNKVPSQDMMNLAEECGIALMTTGLRMFEACGKLYASGLNETALLSESGDFGE